MNSETQRASLLGRAAETAVANYLEQQGFAIVARNLRVGYLEVDIVARQDDLVVLVEVRSRGPNSWTTALGSIDSAKRQRLRRAGERLWSRRYRNDLSVNRLRFDVASVTFNGDGLAEIEYIPAAF